MDRSFSLKEVFAIGSASLVIGYYLAKRTKANNATLSKASDAKSSGNAVRSVTASGSSGSAVYNTQKATQEYLQFHYAPGNELVPYSRDVMCNHLDFATRAAQITAAACPGGGRALDIGCATGRTVFELCRSFNEAIGIDFSPAFIKAALTLRSTGIMDYEAAEEGEIISYHQARVAADIQRERSNFFVGDACNLDPKLGVFNAVVACNLMCRVPSPKKFLASMRSFVAPGGVFVLISPYSWLTEYTAKEEWLGGTNDKKDNTALIQAALGNEFSLVKEEDVSFIIREHRRKFQLGVSKVLIWKRA